MTHNKTIDIKFPKYPPVNFELKNDNKLDEVRPNSTAVETATQELFRQVSAVLFYQWDVIGINKNPSCRSEYDSYVPVVIHYLSKKSHVNGLRNLLLHLATNTIGLSVAEGSTRFSNLISVVASLKDCKHHIERKYTLKIQSPYTSLKSTDFDVQIAKSVAHTQSNKVDCLMLTNQWTVDSPQKIIPTNFEKLNTHVSDMLYYKWNPLNVLLHPVTRNCYVVYDSMIHSQLHSGITLQELNAVIDNANTDFSSNKSMKSKNRFVAEQLIEWRSLLWESKTSNQ
jgi:hypothetical protein